MEKSLASFEIDSRKMETISDGFDKLPHFSGVKLHTLAVVSKDRLVSAVTLPIMVDESGTFLQKKEKSF